MTVERKDLACRIYQFMYESCCGYEDSMAYETAETVLNIFADLTDEKAITSWMEEIVKELQYCTDGDLSSKQNACLISDTDVKSHVEEGYEIVKDLFYLIVERCCV